MIIKIKTFSGESLYIPEEDYLDEVMYSENLEEREFGKYGQEAAKNFFTKVRGRAATKKLQDKGRARVLEGELARMKKAVGYENQFLSDAAKNPDISNRTRIRRATAKNHMWDGTYAEDMGLTPREERNLRITKENSAMLSWSGKHGTKLGNVASKR